MRRRISNIKLSKPAPTHSFSTVSLIHARTRRHTRTMIQPKDIYILIACEESQAECQAFRERGFKAYSCDIQPVRRGGNPYWHIQGDVTRLLHGDTAFNVQAGYLRCVPRWDMIIAHPPCTYICKVGSVWMKRNGVIDPDRFAKMQQAVKFFYECLGASARYVAVENPLPMKLAGLPHPDTYVCPSWFGVKYTKKTLYWLRNLPPIMPEIEHSHPKSFVHSSRGKYRSRTFPQLAQALAKQWGDFILDELRKEESTTK